MTRRLPNVRAWLAGTAVALAAVQALSAQQPAAGAAQQPAQPPTFRAGTQLVIRNVTVRDKNGKVIEGLTAKDFVVIEDKDPQDIAFVEFQQMKKSADTAVALASAPPPSVKPPTPLEGQTAVISTPPSGGI